MNYEQLNDFELINMARENEEANEYLYKKYAPLITKLAKKFYIINQKNGVELSDMIQEANIGLSHAIEYYREDNEILFFTYASACINRSLVSYTLFLNRQKHYALNSAISLDKYEESKKNNLLDSLAKSDDQNPINILVAKENKKILYKKLKPKLTNLEITVLELKDFGFNYKDIALLLGKSEKAIDNALQRIKLKAKNIK